MFCNKKIILSGSMKNKSKESTKSLKNIIDMTVVLIIAFLIGFLVMI